MRRLRIKWQYLAILFIGIAIGSYFTLYWPAPTVQAKVVTLKSRGVSYTVATTASDISALLAEQGLTADEAAVEPAADTMIRNGMLIYYHAPLALTVIDGSSRRTLISTAETVGDALSTAGIQVHPADVVAPGLDTHLTHDATVVIQRITEMEETVNEPIAFATQIQGDPDLLYGKEEIVRAGQPGTREVRYLVTLKNGSEVARKKLSAEVISEPVDAVVRAGRKIVVEAYEQGGASWYAYKKCLCAAHPFFPKGSHLRVTNLANNASVIVRVNDWGPDQNVHATRIVDLDAEAFKLLAPLSLGTIAVKVEKLKAE